MSDNPFKIIQPREEVPDNLKKDVMGSVKAVVLVLRFIQLFVGDYTAVFLDKFKTQEHPKNDQS